MGTRMRQIFRVLVCTVGRKSVVDPRPECRLCIMYVLFADEMRPGWWMSAVVLALQDGVFQSRALDGSESIWFETRR